MKPGLVGVLLVLTGVVACASPSPSELMARPAIVDVDSLADALREAGAHVELGRTFHDTAVGAQGHSLCVDGALVGVYRYETAAEAERVAEGVDRDDPSNFRHGVSIAWAGNPRFWRAGRLIVLYLGSDSAVERRLTSVLGRPFAQGTGRSSDESGECS